MSMIGHIRQITPDELRKMQRNPASVRKLLHGKVRAKSANVRAALERVTEFGKQAMLTGAGKDPARREEIRLQILRELESAGVKLPGDGPNEDGLSMEKSWHTLHYLLTGSAEEVTSPLGNAILGGKPLGDDVGYGPARFLTPKKVREVAAALAQLSKDDLTRRFDLPAMLAAQIYACNDEGELELAMHYFDHMVRYYADAAAHGNAMLLYID
jgi:Domain of unknown function (DUF1877)